MKLRLMSSDLADDNLASMPLDYFAFGLHLRSELELPEISTVTAVCDAPVVDIRLGTTGEIPAARYVDTACQISADDCLLNVDGVARYRVRNGEEIIVEPFSASFERRVRLFLLGTVFGTLCHQRGLLPLHASAIEVDGRAIAFAGVSGAGKSTLAAHFHDRGYPVLCDDLCAIHFDRSARPMVSQGIPRLKLWRDAAKMLGWQFHSGEIDVDGQEKYQFPTGRASAGTTLALHRIYVLEDVRLSAQQRICRLKGVDATDALLLHTYRRGLLAPMGRTAINFMQSTSIAKRACVYSFSRCLGFDNFAAEAEKLEGHFLKAGNARPGRYG